MEDFISKTLNLLQIERTTELEENLNNRSNISIKELEKQGICISKLIIASVKSGLFDRVLVKVKKEFTDLPPHKISSGDLVGVFSTDIKNPEFNATVYKVTPNHIVLAGDSRFEQPEGKVSIVLLANEATYKRQTETMKRLKDLPSREIAYDLAEVLLGNSQAKVSMKTSELQFFNSNLNPIQQEAVKFVLDQCTHVGVIHGPPGTGKTTTVIEVIKQAAKRGLKVLATAPSNIAVDNLVEKLQDLRIVRIGHPARMLESIVQHSFDSLIKKTDSYQISKDIRNELSQLIRSRQNRSEMKALHKELKERGLKSSQEVLSSSQVVLATCISSASTAVETYAKSIQGFDLIVIDEAAQALECACWVPILMGKKVILAGDHKQLPPTIISKKAASEGLQVSLMERICELYPQVTVLLQVQYRMNSLIMDWSNEEFYNGKLIADASVRDEVLQDYPNPLVLIDTSGGGVFESGEISKYNPGEAEIVGKFVAELKDLGIRDISVVTPYNAQVELLKTLMPELEIATVDGFQGREKEVIIISMVRSNTHREVGFLSDFRRLNVAVTRAKKMVCVVTDADTVGNPEAPQFLKNFVKYFRDKAHCLNFQEYFTGGIDSSSFAKNKSKFEPKQKESNESKKSKKSKEKKQEATKIKNPEPESKEIEIIDALKECKRMIQQFIKSDSQEMKTQTFDAKDRHEIHELCEKLKLYHKTLGNSKQKNRSMYISKATPVRESKNIGFEKNELLDEDLEEEKNIGVEFQGQTKLRKEVKVEEYDEADFLEKAMKDANSCMKLGCQKNIQLFKTVCEFCHKGFCFQHGLAEAHGCGNRAHMAALGAPPRPGKLQETKINELKGRLHDKIDKISHKKPEKKNKKKK